MNSIKKQSNFFPIIFLIAICYVLYAINLNSYPLIDTDETKYVSIARDLINNNDWINTKLNGVDYFETPPLIFWLINASFIAFGKISAQAARFPFAMMAIMIITMSFISISKILTKSFALITSLILASSLGFLVFSRIATNDILFITTTMFAILCVYNILFGNKATPKKQLWLLTYISIAFSILSGGLFGILIPVISIIAIYTFAGKLKEIIKPTNIIMGLIIITAIVSPWFLIMFQKHESIFVEEFIGMYTLFKFSGIKESGLVILFFILGFLPWSFSFLWIIGSKIFKIKDSIVSYFKDNSQSKLEEKWKMLNKTDKFISVNTIVFFISFILAILYGSKHTYLILFLLFPASCITGYYWYEYLFRKEHDKSIFFATIIPNILLITCSILALIGYNFANTLITDGFNYLILPLTIIFFVIPLLGIFAVILKGKMASYVSNIILMISLSFVLAPSIFNFIVTNGGEKDLIKFANIAQNENAVITTYMKAKKYSLTYYYDGKINFNNNNDINWLKQYMIENPNHYIITTIKELWNIEDNDISYMLLDSGKRYCMIKYKNKTKNDDKNKDEEPKVIVY